MKKYVLKRVLIALVTLLVILLVLFALLKLMPGTPFNDEKLNEAQKAALMAKYGLDQPIIVQFFNYVTNMLHGDLGVSYNISKNTPIAQLLQTRLPTSLRIGGQSVLLGAVVGLLLGIVAALKHNSIWDTLCTVVSVLGVSVPSYVFALFLAYTCGFQLGWFPQLYQINHPFISSVLPSVALITRHTLRNALIPIITVLAPLIVSLMTGSLVVEKIFSIPGIGSLMVQAIQSNDYSVTIALAFVYSAMYVGIMLVVDILYGIIDPRIRLAKEDNHE